MPKQKAERWVMKAEHRAMLMMLKRAGPKGMTFHLFRQRCSRFGRGYEIEHFLRGMLWSGEIEWIDNGCTELELALDSELTSAQRKMLSKFLDKGKKITLSQFIKNIGDFTITRARRAPVDLLKITDQGLATLKETQPHSKVLRQRIKKRRRYK